MASGGYRAPSHPAPVSNPGAGSARTDGGPVHAAEALAGGKYGAAQQAGQLATSAAMTPSAPSMGNQALGQALSQGGLNFGAGTAQPNTPVTAGSQYGPGPDQSVLQANDPTRTEALALAQQGYIPVLVHMADAEDATPAFKKYVRLVLAALPTS